MTPLSITSGSVYEPYSYVYDNCNSLTSDIITLIPVEGFISKKVTLYKTFADCKNITCSNFNLLANYFWNDTSKIFSEYSTTFKGSNIITQYGDQIPKSWGGTKA